MESSLESNGGDNDNADDDDNIDYDDEDDDDDDHDDDDYDDDDDDEDRAPVAQLAEHRAAVQEVMTSTPVGPSLRVLK